MVYRLKEIPLIYTFTSLVVEHVFFIIHCYLFIYLFCTEYFNTEYVDRLS